jgi:murein DD-endopeptidase MepM/ murein hydrolase activator NlpD
MSGKHSAVRAAPNRRERSLRSKPKTPLRRLLAAAVATIVSLGLASALALPAASATGAAGEIQAQAIAHGPTQSVSVARNASMASVVRDKIVIGKAYPQGGPGIGSVDGWAKPIDRPIVSPWGPRQVICTSGVGCDSGFHRGDDFAAPCGTPFYAASGGTVTSVTYAGLAGDEIVITYGQGISTAYSHMFDSGVLVAVGEKVVAGQNIGQVGSSGDSTGCHLYFEYRIQGLTVDPVPAMASHGIQLG